MSFIGAVGTVAQQGNQAAAGCSSAPSGISLATTSGSGHWDDAVIVHSMLTGSSGEDNLDSNDGSDFSYSAPFSAATIDFQPGPDYEAMLNNNSGVLRFACSGYIRETSTGANVATSWAWVMKSLTYDDTSYGAVSSVSIGGSASTNQDATSSGTGQYAQITHSSGGRGYLQMTQGDYLQWIMRAEATNACGSTYNDPDLQIKIEWVL